MGLDLLRVKKNGSHVSWFLDQSFYEIMVAIRSFIVKAIVPGVLCAILCTI